MGLNAPQSSLQSQALHLQFGDQILIQDLNINFKAGLNVILGRNGSGKTTLIRSLSGWISGQSGSVLIDGQVIRHLNPQVLAKKMSVVRTQKDRPGFFPVSDFLEMGRFPYLGFWGQITESDQQLIDRVVKLTGIETLLSKRLDQLSDGEYQKVAISQALIQETEILLLDEPTSHLDVVNRIEVFRLLKSLGDSGKCVVVATHELDLALQLADQILLLNGEGQYLHGTPQEILASNSLQEIFSSDQLFFDPNTKSFRAK